MRDRDPATAWLIPLCIKRPQPESAAATTKTQWRYYHTIRPERGRENQKLAVGLALAWLVFGIDDACALQKPSDI
jgi:hypothetical protein